MKGESNTCRELQPYLSVSEFGRAGSAGKQGMLRLDFELDASGRSILRHLFRRVPLVVQQALYFDEEMPELPCVYILSSGGPNVDGDRYDQQFTVGAGACAFISTGAATKIAEMHHDCSSLTQLIRLDDDAYLEYLPEPVIPCRHARYVTDTRLIVAPSATLVYAEIFTSGRRYYGSGERFAYDLLSLTTRGERPEGQVLFREKMIVEPARTGLTALGAMGGYDVMANAIVMTPPRPAEALLNQAVLWPDRGGSWTAGITSLPGGAGVQYKVLGTDTESVKRCVRQFCSTVRQVVKGHPLPPEFPWR